MTRKTLGGLGALILLVTACSGNGTSTATSPTSSPITSSTTSAVSTVPDPATPSGATAASDTGSSLPGVAVSVGAGTEQLTVTGSEPGRQLTAYDSTGAAVVSGTVDEMGALVFRGLEGGDEYVVGDDADRTDTVTTLAREDHPDAAFFAEQRLPTDGLGYIATRDGTTLSASVWLPGTAVPNAEARAWYLADDSALATEPATDAGESSYPALPDATSPTWFDESTGSIWSVDVTYDWQEGGAGTFVDWATDELADDAVVVGSGSIDLWLRADFLTGPPTTPTSRSRSLRSDPTARSSTCRAAGCGRRTERSTTRHRPSCARCRHTAKRTPLRYPATSSNSSASSCSRSLTRSERAAGSD